MAVKATASLWPTEEKLGVAGSVRKELRFRSGVWLSWGRWFCFFGFGRGRESL